MQRLLRVLPVFVALAAVLMLLSCGGSASESEDSAMAATPSGSAGEGLAHDAWWRNLTSLCGNAYGGRLLSADAADAELADQPMVLHVRKCEPNRIEVPFHIGENRSRTWVLTRTDSGIQLEHDHRHEDGTADAVTLYGGHTVAPGTEIVQFFPADAYSKELFVAEGLAVSSANVWSMEIMLGQRFSYNLRRPERFFRADFDLAQTVDPPPAPWGFE